MFCCRVLNFYINGILRFGNKIDGIENPQEGRHILIL